MSDKSEQIHDAIQQFQLGGEPEEMMSRVLDILEKMNRRMDAIEATHRRLDNDRSRAQQTE